jgi:hypothetical protein
MGNRVMGFTVQGWGNGQEGIAVRRSPDRARPRTTGLHMPQSELKRYVRRKSSGD